MKILKTERCGPLAIDDQVTIRMSRQDLKNSMDALEGYVTKTRGLDFDKVRHAVLTVQHYRDALRIERERRS